jgi:hypothetical protein
MGTSKFTETQIVSTLKQADAGVPLKDVCPEAGISVATYYQWKSKYGGLEASERGRSVLIHLYRRRRVGRLASSTGPSVATLPMFRSSKRMAAGPEHGARRIRIQREHVVLE